MNKKEILGIVRIGAGLQEMPKSLTRKANNLLADLIDLHKIKKVLVDEEGLKLVDRIIAKKTMRMVQSITDSEAE